MMSEIDAKTEAEIISLIDRIRSIPVERYTRMGGLTYICPCCRRSVSVPEKGGNKSISDIDHCEDCIVKMADSLSAVLKK